MFCDVLVYVRNSSGGWIKSPFPENYYLVHSFTGYKRKIYAYQPPKRFIADYANHILSIGSVQSPKIQSEFYPIIKEYDPQLLYDYKYLVKMHEYVYYMRENDVDYYYKFHTETNEITAVPLRSFFY